jgi:hypothetical protein
MAAATVLVTLHACPKRPATEQYNAESAITFEFAIDVQSPFPI